MGAIRAIIYYILYSVINNIIYFYYNYLYIHKIYIYYFIIHQEPTRTPLCKSWENTEFPFSARKFAVGPQLTVHL